MNTRAHPRPYRLGARAEARDRTRAALIAAAGSRLLAAPWHEVALERIAADAGVTKQTLLRHFGSKAGLLEAVMRTGHQRVREERFAVAPGDVEGAVDNLLDHYETWSPYALRLGEADDVAAFGAIARRLHYEWVDHVFGPRLAGLRPARRARRRAALIALCDVHAWLVLSRDLGLTRAEVRATLLDSIARLTEEPA